MKHAALIMALTAPVSPTEAPLDPPGDPIREESAAMAEPEAQVLVDGAPVLEVEEAAPFAAPRGAVLAYAGEALPWSAYGLLWERPSEGRPWFIAVGAGRFKQTAYPHAQEELDIQSLARSLSVGGQWQMLSPVFSLRAGLGLTTFSGSFTQRGTDISGQATAEELLGSGFDGKVVTSFFSGVFSYDIGPARIEFVPVGFRFALWRSIKQDLETPHQVGLNRYLGGNTVFGLVNLAAGVTF